MLLTTAVLGLLLTAADPKPAAVRLEGVVTYTGPIPKPIAVPEAGTSRQLIEVHGKTRTLKDAVVWLEGVPAARDAGAEKLATLTMDQRNYVYAPHVLAVRVGQEVEFQNRDSVNHCLQANSSESSNSFNRLTPPGSKYRHR